MDKRTLTEKIVKVLTMVPLPFVPQAAAVAEAILAVAHEAHVDAEEAGQAPPTLAELQEAVAAALPEAQEPWRHVKATAENELNKGPRP